MSWKSSQLNILSLLFLRQEMQIMKQYIQLTCELRYQLYALNKSGMKQTQIARELGVDQSSISRELKRNKGKRGYRPKQANEKANARKKETIKSRVMTTKMIDKITVLLKAFWSPEQISGTLQSDINETLSVSHETIYKFIWADKANGGILYKCLRRKAKKYTSRCKEKQAGRGFIKERIGIEERPSIVDERLRVGDWEIDLVIGKGHSGALLTIVERVTRYTVTKRIFDKSSRTVTDATIELLAPFISCVLTITADNGKEFAYHKEVSESLGCGYYFADPYCSWQRGLNENTNGLLRQYWPKSTDFKLVSNEDVLVNVIQLNNRPRKKLFFKTPLQMMAMHIPALAA
jgi:IS30 family transposase